MPWALVVEASNDKNAVAAVDLNNIFVRTSVKELVFETTGERRQWVPAVLLYVPQGVSLPAFSLLRLAFGQPLRKKITTENVAPW